MNDPPRPDVSYRDSVGVVSLGGDVSGFVPPNVLPKLMEKLKR